MTRSGDETGGKASALTPAQRAMVDTWERHMAAGFERRSVDAAMETMTAAPAVTHVPVLTGGVGAEEVREFYRRYFIDAQPPDSRIVPVSRTVGEGRIVDELLYRFTHSVEMPWMLPGLAPTGRAVEVVLVVVVEFAGDRIGAQRIYWDQASVLAQLGLLDSGALPVAGGESARRAADAASEPSNVLIARARRTTPVDARGKLGVEEDLAGLSREALMDEVHKLRDGIRRHRDSTGHELCWHHPALWGLLPERQDPLPTVPAWPEFIRGCVRYRQSLDHQLPDAPRSARPYDR